MILGTALRVLFVGIIAAVPGAAGDEWAEAAGYAQRFAGSKDPSERAQAAARLAAGMDGKHDRQAAQMIVAILQSECAREAGGRKEHEVAGDVLQACENSLKKASAKEAVEFVVHQAQKNLLIRVRIHLARALGGIRSDEALKALLGLLADKDAKVVIGACDGLKEQASESAIDAMLKLLKDPAAPWEGKLSVIEGLEKIDKPEACVDGLIEALALLPVDQGRLRVEIIRILGKYCGIEDPKADDPGWWKAAWADKKAGRDPARDHGTTTEPTEFFGLKTRSSRIVFILDRTGSMEDPCAFPPADPRKPPERPPEPTGRKLSPAELSARAEADRLLKKWEEAKVSRKIEGLKREFTRTIHGLDPRVRFAVVWYESNPTPWKDEFLPATWVNKLDCLREIDKLAPSGPTNIWGGIETAYRFAEAPHRPDVVQVDKKGNYATVVKGADTFFLMTDGNHNTGRFVTKSEPASTDAFAFLSEIRKVNALRKVAIHVVALGNVGGGADPLTPASLEFLQKIAGETGGQFTHIGRP